MGSTSEAQRLPTPGCLLLDTHSDEISTSRIWLRESPIGYVCIGLGPSAKLARFAFEDEAPEDLFYAACRRYESALSRDGLAKARRIGLEIPFGSFEDPALRRLAIASVLVKAGFDPAEPRVPGGQPDGGEWTNGSDSGQAETQLATARRDSTQSRKEQFVDAHLAAAQRAADELGIPVENILGISALESGWGKGNRFVMQGNNFFGIHYPAPVANGYMWTSDHKTRVATFASYEDSLRSFVATSGSLVRGVTDPAAFATALQDSGKFGITRSGSRVPTYVGELAKTIRGLRSMVERRRA